MVFPASGVSSFLTALLTMGILLLLMMFLHEMGHVLAAKVFGVRVDVCSLGFGRCVRQWLFWDIYWRISILPLGAYTKLAGETPWEATGDPMEYFSKSRGVRIIIGLMGAAANVLFAIALLTVWYSVGHHYERPSFLDDPAVIGWVLENSPAAKAGLLRGDRIIRIENQQHPTWEEVMLTVAMHQPQVDLAVQRGNEILEKEIQPELKSSDQYSGVGWLPHELIVVISVENETPAAKAGLKPGDFLVAINGMPMYSQFSVMHFLQRNGRMPVDVTVVRNNNEMHSQITPVVAGEDGKKSFDLGFRSEPVNVDKLPWRQALNRSIQENGKYCFLFRDLVRKMVDRKFATKQIDRPIGMVGVSGEAYQPGWTPLVYLTAMISVNLGIINLLPIPMLDGGAILVLIIESIIRRDISMRIKERIYQTAFVILMLFIVVVIYNDLLKAVSGLSHRLP